MLCVKLPSGAIISYVPIKPLVPSKHLLMSEESPKKPSTPSEPQPKNPRRTKRLRQSGES
jgi:hypothetical protein